MVPKTYLKSQKLYQTYRHLWNAAPFNTNYQR